MVAVVIDSVNENKVWDLVYNSYHSDDSIYEKYLNANSIEEFKEIFIDSIDLSDGLYLSVKDRYVDKLNHLINILMDLSEEDYFEFKKRFYSYDSICEVISACEVLAEMILKNKRKQIVYLEVTEL